MKTGNGMENVAARLPTSMIVEIDAYKEDVSTMWRDATRSEAIRYLIGLGLVAAKVARKRPAHAGDTPFSATRKRREKRARSA